MGTRSIPLVLLAAGACSAAPAPDPQTPGTPSATHVYACPGGYDFTARVLGERATLVLADRTVELRQVPAASGARYAGDGFEFWNRGDEASLETPAGSHAGCRERPAQGPWEAARLRGADFRAVGQEPGWVLEIEEGRRITFATDYGETRVQAPAPAPEVDSGTGRATYRARGGAHALTVVVERAPCSDIMSGEHYPRTVRVTLDGREHAGCGMPLTPAEGRVTGRLLYRERIALPPDAVVRVALVDVSLQDAPATVLDAEEFRLEGRQVPVPFSLEYDPASVLPDRTYAVQASIRVDGRLTFTTTEHYPVLTGGAPADVEVVLEKVG